MDRSFTRARPGLLPAVVAAAAMFVLPLESARARAAQPADDVPSGPTVTDLPLGDGQSQRVLRLAPPDPRGTLVMLPGGSGKLDIAPEATLRHGHNFVVRTRDAWVARGFAVVIPDAIGSESLRGRRSSAGYARVIQTLVTFATARLRAPVWLLGTSQGSIAAMNGAAHAAPGTLAGVVLTEPVSRLGGSHETVFDADPGAVRVPVLLIANRDDACVVAPPGDAPAIAATLVHATDVTVRTIGGGIHQSGRACGSLTPHGYDGIEPQVIEIVTNWLDAYPRTRRSVTPAGRDGPRPR